MRYFVNIVALVFLVALCSCGARGKSDKKVIQSGGDTLLVEYAKGFSVVDCGEYSLVEILDPSGESKKTYSYVLADKHISLDSLPKGYQVIRTPINKAICMTTLQLSGFIKLGEVERVVGITSTKFVQDSTIKSGLNSGRVKRIGIEGEFDNEVVMNISPDVIFISPFKRGGYGAITELGIATFNYLGYKEPSPLGQAEWIKLIGIMTGEQERAQQIFAQTKERYLTLKAKVKDVEQRPTILSGELHSGSWYVVGGKSYLAHLFEDAGANYFMHGDSRTGGFYIDYEKVYAQGHDADYWRIVNSHNGEFSYKALGGADSRYSDFKAYKERNVIYCNLREKPFYERTPMEPDVVLADLIKIFHPSLLAEHKGVYYTLLK